MWVIGRELDPPDCQVPTISTLTSIFCAATIAALVSTTAHRRPLGADVTLLSVSYLLLGRAFVKAARCGDNGSGHYPVDTQVEAVRRLGIGGEVRGWNPRCLSINCTACRKRHPNQQAHPAWPRADGGSGERTAAIRPSRYDHDTTLKPLYLFIRTVDCFSRPLRAGGVAIALPLDAHRAAVGAGGWARRRRWASATYNRILNSSRWLFVISMKTSKIMEWGIGKMRFKCWILLRNNLIF